MPSITNGADADEFMDGANTPSTRSFVNSESSAAAVVLTSAPTQFVRFFNPTDALNKSDAIGSFIAGSNDVRGLTPEQIRDVLALAATPTMQAIVQVPAGTCLLIGMGGPILNSASPPPVWGHGGVVQYYLIGRQQDSAGCSSSAQYPLFIPATSYIDAQPIGAQALLYGPRAGAGNPGAVAGALDAGPYPASFTGMDSLYNSLDLLNSDAEADPTALREALLQLDGEVHASARTVMLSDSVYLRETLLGRMRQASFIGGIGPTAALGLGGPSLAYLGGTDSRSRDSDSTLAYAARSKPSFPLKAPPPPELPAPETVFWVQGIGAWGKLDGNGIAANAHRDLAGVFAGIDRRFAPNWLVGIAGGYTNSSLSIADPASSAGIKTGHVAGYTAASFGPWNLRAAASGSFHTIDTNRDINFPVFSGPTPSILPNFSDSESARYHATTTQVFGEVGYGTSFGQIATEPFGGLAFVHLDTDSFAENGATNAAALSGSGSKEDVGYSSLGARAAINYVLANGFILTPHVSAAWQHAFGDVNPTAALAFESNGASFVTAGVPLARDAALVEAGIDLNLTRQLALQVSYFGQLASRIQDNSVMGNLRWRF